MAAVATRHSGIDLRNSATHQVQLGSSLRQSTSQRRYSSVRFNHKPDVSHHDDTTTSITRLREPASGIQVSLKDGNDEYCFKGGRKDAKHTYVLLPDKDGSGYVLEQLSTEYAVNLATAPWEANAAKLAQQYPQLPATLHSAIQEDDFAGGGDSMEVEDDSLPDPNNPYDFRHHLTASAPRPSAKPQNNSIASNRTPVPRHSTTNTPEARPSRKTTSASAFLSKADKPKVKQSSSQVQRSGEQQSAAADNKRQSSVPTVRLDRRASTKIKVDVDDSGDLILEGDLPEMSNRRQGARSLGLALSGQFGKGPISLRSAASSPASRGGSPMLPRPSHFGRHPDSNSDGDVEMDDGENSQHSNAVGQDQDSDAEADDDVDDLQLPSPARVQRPSLGGATVTADDDDDLEKQMLMALEQDDDDAPAVPAMSGVMSDEESEEE